VLVVAEELHSGRDTAHLSLTQPPLSQQTGLIEQEIGPASTSGCRLRHPYKLLLEMTVPGAALGLVDGMTSPHPSAAPALPPVATPGASARSHQFQDQLLSGPGRACPAPARRADLTRPGC
jgi:hypothetical protein